MYQVLPLFQLWVRNDDGTARSSGSKNLVNVGFGISLELLERALVPSTILGVMLKFTYDTGAIAAPRKISVRGKIIVAHYFSSSGGKNGAYKQHNQFKLLHIPSDFFNKATVSSNLEMIYECDDSTSSVVGSVSLRLQKSQPI